ncbi:NAD(P)H-dependent oxidoreductase [Phyllobacterium sophorae]|uniref:NAD(P)H-dependent oxidoreductase n=1 Tax=Phyllobacterium sophorae TaxID=1520277 RepID=UPI0011B22197|nr:NAD(P)H-dependent oxidoreductase [Phyllobacterium sophorae]
MQGAKGDLNYDASRRKEAVTDWWLYMHTLILLAHPEKNSLNVQLARSAQEKLKWNGNSVELVDLYREAFDPLEAEHHYAKRLNEAFFSPYRNKATSDLGTLPPDVMRAIDQLDRADLVVFQFPLWWWLMPAILKGWIDRVFVWGSVFTSKMRYWRRARTAPPRLDMGNRGGEISVADGTGLGRRGAEVCNSSAMSPSSPRPGAPDGSTVRPRS